MASRALKNARKLRNIIDAKADFGIKADGTDETTKIQQAIDAAVDIGGTLYLPTGDGTAYVAEQLTISGNCRITGDEPAKTVIRQGSGVNDNFITIPYTVVQNPIIENLTIDGNRTGNTTSGHALYLEDHAEPDASVTYGFSVVLRNAYIQNAREDCLHVGTNRNLGHVENVELKRGGRCFYVKAGSDWRLVHTRFAFPLTTHAIEIEAGADNVFMAGSAYGATLAECVRIKNVSNSPTKLIGMTINGNSREGLHISGPNGIARTIAHVVQGCWFEGNSLLTDDTYSDIKLTDIAGVILSGNTFRWTGSGNRPKYLVEFAGTTVQVEWTGNSYSRSTLPYGTAVTNTDFRLFTYVEGLDIGGQLQFDMAYLPNHADDAAAAAGGVSVGRPYRTGSTLKVRVS